LTSKTEYAFLPASDEWIDPRNMPRFKIQSSRLAFKSLNNRLKTKP